MWAEYVTLNVKAERTWSDSDFNVSRYYFIIFLLKSGAKKSDAFLRRMFGF